MIVCVMCRVDILVFDTQGHRHKLRGRQGQTLVELLADNGDVLGDGELSRPIYVIYMSCHLRHIVLLQCFPCCCSHVQ